jgi:tetratricopeptide (TPR) repeat protein
MMTPENKAVSWVLHVNGWLNKYGNSSLSDPATLLLVRLEREHARNELKKAWDIIDDLNRLSDISEGLESAEIRLRCGLVVAAMGNFKEAQKFFSEASSKYSHSHHHYAIAQWMKGCMEWLLPGKEVDAINSWREAKKKFETLRTGKESKKDEYSWYDTRCKEMHMALHQAAEKYEIPSLPIDADKSENTVNKGDNKNTDDSADLRSDRMGLFSIYEYINAGSFGPSGILEASVGDLEVEQVFIDDKPFGILTVNGSRFFKASMQDTILVKVVGDSMNLANILNGDYVLLRLLPKSFSDFNGLDNPTDIFSSQNFKDGDIVAAEIIDKEGDTTTLKRVFHRGKKIILQPQSTNPDYTEREFDITDEGFCIRGKVLAILKPI